MATYAIGDLQGCYDELRQLLALFDFQPQRDCLWLVGDLVNRGPKSLEVLRFVKVLQEQGSARVVLGNHDLSLILRAAGYGKASKSDTLDDILNAPDRAELLRWLQRQPLLYREGDYLMVHAGLLPLWSAEQAAALAAEVHAALLAPNADEFLAHMWGSRPDGWQDELVGWDRLRVVVNVMTRMRFIDQHGRMDFHFAGPPDQALALDAGLLPWFAVPGRKSADVTIVCGHWSALGLRVEPNLLALDTGCLWGGALSAVRLEDRAVFQLPCPQQVAPDGW